MANKVKMKCAVCHKAFKSSKPTQTLCDDCERKRRLERGAQPVATKAAPVVTREAAKPTWLTQSVEQAPKEPEPFAAPPPRIIPRDRPVSPERPIGPRPEARPAAGPRPHGPPTRFAPKSPRSVTVRAPRPLKPPKEPIKPFEPSPDQVSAIEARYLELAQPEFDGIRTRIAEELAIPKTAVKRVIAALRAREHVPSWWELQTYSGTPEELARIRAAYEPHLPVPPVGIHRALAKELNLPPAKIYLGIRHVRDELRLPPFNPPEAHPERPAVATPEPA